MNFATLGKHKRFLLAFALVVSLIVVWWFSPSPYLDLYIPIPSYHSDIWNHTQRTTLSYTGESGVEYLLRRDGTAYTEVVGWQNAREGLSFIDRWLVERGWERTDMYTEGDPALPETDFLRFGETYAVYTDPEDRSGFGGQRRGALGRVTVAVWPIGGSSGPSECSVAGFNVVVVTVKPSVWRVVTTAFDD
jgi:hypothetical protein